MSYKITAHSDNYWNDFADSLVNSAHTVDSAIHISQFEQSFISAIHNNFIHKLRRHVWDARIIDKSHWKCSVNISTTLKTQPRLSNLSKFTYLSFSTLPSPDNNMFKAYIGVYIAFSLKKIRLIIPNQCKNNNSNPKGALLFEKKEKAANGSSSDTSSSDTEHNKTDKTPQKRTRITSKVDMDENFTADIAVADMGLDTFTSQPIFLIPAGPSS
ncbi:hypothetical protein RhiirA5_423088 [Rhizophagus irregularis]|uniref:Uncharacterized protein n=1 Tax=Rhizophagus irregularis TaxID=588596 RepID=A0A2N0PAN0_9GLOM|nr:hypothetical protein RhiirA5_423088 [Rhizophagus irregularis]